MKNVLAIAALAIAVAGTASASNSQLVAGAQSKLDNYGFSVDADTLTRSQIAALHFVDTNEGSKSSVRAEIASVIK